MYYMNRSLGTQEIQTTPAARVLTEYDSTNWGFDIPTLDQWGLPTTWQRWTQYTLAIADSLEGRFPYAKFTTLQFLRVVEELDRMNILPAPLEELLAPDGWLLTAITIISLHLPYDQVTLRLNHDDQLKIDYSPLPEPVKVLIMLEEETKLPPIAALPPVELQFDGADNIRARVGDNTTSNYYTWVAETLAELANKINHHSFIVGIVPVRTAISRLIDVVVGVPRGPDLAAGRDELDKLTAVLAPITPISYSSLNPEWDQYLKEKTSQLKRTPYKQPMGILSIASRLHRTDPGGDWKTLVTNQLPLHACKATRETPALGLFFGVTPLLRLTERMLNRAPWNREKCIHTRFADHQITQIHDGDNWSAAPNDPKNQLSILEIANFALN